MNNLPTKSLLIFDFDGTLIDSVPDLAAAINSMLSQLGKPTHTIDAVRNWVGNGARPLIVRALRGNTEATTSEVDIKTLEHAEALFFDAYASIHNDKSNGSKTTAYPNVDTGLNTLHDAGFTLALVTNKPIQFVPKILQRFGWQDLFSEVLGGDSLPVKKPDPAPLLHVCNQLGVSPSQAVMIGDSKNDILAGQRAGMDTLGLSYGYNYGQHISEFNPTKSFDDFAELVAFILKNYTNNNQGL